MPSTCHFKLNKENGVYYADKDVVAGTVRLTTTNEKKYDSIYVVFIGEIKCQFPNIRRPEENIHSNLVLFDEKLILRKNGVLPAGTYSWSFWFNVPSVCHTSVECQYGHIRYELYLIISNSGGKYNNIFIKPITVIANLDLNASLDYKLPQQTEIYADCCFSVDQFKLYYVLSTEHSGYAAGQNLRYDLNVYYKNLNNIRCYHFKFVRKTTYHTYGRRYCYRVFKTVIHEEQVEDNGQTIQTHTGFVFLKSIAPTTYAQILYVEYFLQVKANIFNSHNEFKIKIPVIIGTVPVRTSLTLHQSVWVDPLLVASPHGRSQLNYKINPPYFEEAHRYEPAFRDSTELEINRVDDFLPTYPMFKSIVSADAIEDE